MFAVASSGSPCFRLSPNPLYPELRSHRNSFKAQVILCLPLPLSYNGSSSPVAPSQRKSQSCREEAQAARAAITHATELVPKQHVYSSQFQRQQVHEQGASLVERASSCPVTGHLHHVLLNAASLSPSSYKATDLN